jgi:hypothetical protein
MGTFRLAIDIRRPPSDVFTFVAEMQNMPLWYDAIQQVTKTTPGPTAAGSRYQIVRSLPAHKPVGPAGPRFRYRVPRPLSLQSSRPLRLWPGDCRGRCRHNGPATAPGRTSLRSALGSYLRDLAPPPLRRARSAGSPPCASRVMRTTRLSTRAPASTTRLRGRAEMFAQQRPKAGSVGRTVWPWTDTLLGESAALPSRRSARAACADSARGVRYDLFCAPALAGMRRV